MDPMITSALIGLGGEAVGLGLQEKYHRRQIEGQKELGKFNQNLALETWDKTNYEAQRKHMERAGLNVGLMYKGAGEGGTTAGGQATGGVQQGQAGMGMQLGMQIALMQAQKENIEADTANKKADATYKGGPQTANTEGDTAKKGQETKNLTAQEKVIELERQLKEIEERVSRQTEETQKQAIRSQAELKGADASRATTQAELEKQTLDEQIRSRELGVTQQEWAVKAVQAGIAKDNATTKSLTKGMEVMQATIERMTAQTGIEWTQIDQKEREILIQRALQENNDQLTDFNTNTAAHVRQWTGIMDDLMMVGSKAKGLKHGNRPIGFK